MPGGVVIGGWVGHPDETPTPAPKAKPAEATRGGTPRPRDDAMDPRYSEYYDAYHCLREGCGIHVTHHPEWRQIRVTHRWRDGREVAQAFHYGEPYGVISRHSIAIHVSRWLSDLHRDSLDPIIPQV